MRRLSDRTAAIDHAAGRVRAAQASIAAAGLRTDLVTGAGTGSFAFEAATGLWGELQCGSYLFMDHEYEAIEAAPTAPVFGQALFVKSQVVSRGIAHAVVDAGHKSHAIESGLPRIWQRDLGFANGGDEHGIVLPATGLAGAGSLRPHREPARSLHRRTRRPRPRPCRGRVDDRRTRPHRLEVWTAGVWQSSAVG